MPLALSRPWIASELLNLWNSFQGLLEYILLREGKEQIVSRALGEAGLVRITS